MIALAARILTITRDEMGILYTLIGTLIAAVIAGVCTIIAMQVRTRAEARRAGAHGAAVHRTLTTNHHASDPPTILDRLDTIQQTQRAQHAELQAVTNRQQTQIEMLQEAGSTMTRHIASEIGGVRDTIRHYHPEETP